MPKIVELDFGMGNIRSLQKAFEYINADITVSSDYHIAQKADVLVLPGDGAFAKAMLELRRLHLLDVILEFIAKKKPILGICIGFQILFSNSHEFQKELGINFFEGALQRFHGDKNNKVPHIGWNPVHFSHSSRLQNNIPNQAFFYFVHSYRVAGRHSYATATSHYGGEFTAIVEKENVFAAQFHPEKSHANGLQFLKNFLKEIS